MIPYGKQEILKEDIDSVVEVLQSPLITQGPKAIEFEEKIATKVDAKYAVSFNSATSALHCAVLALGLREGEWLWTTPISFVASSNCGLYSPRIVILQPDAHHIRVFFIILVDLIKFLRSLIVHALCEDLILAVRILFDQPVYHAPVDTEALAEYFLGRLQILLFIRQHLYIKYHIVHTLAGRYLCAVAVHDIPALKSDHPAVIDLLVQDCLCIFTPFGYIDICDPAYKNNKSQYHCHK